MNKIPGLSSIPLLGALFKSREERKNRTELIVLVTPEITKPLEAGEAAPEPVMPREFMGPATPADKKQSSVTDKPVTQADTSATEKPADPKKQKAGKKGIFKGIFAKKG